tara:strand:+ start:506 stop:733 length:228 start_codon:yes stop_codon:yes gene_type:complete
MNKRRNPIVGDLVSLHSPRGDEETIDIGVVVAVYPKRNAYGAPTTYTTYLVAGKYSTTCEYDEPFWEARIVNPVK